MSRMRGADFKKVMQMILVFNPSRQSYLYEWVKPLLDMETGIPRDGVEKQIRYFVNLNGKMLWGDDPMELFKEHGEPKGLVYGESFVPRSSRFVFMRIFDNPVLMASNPAYLSGLLAQSPQNQLRFLHGSWHSVATKDSYFNRQWVKMIDRVPQGTKIVNRCRAWDLAATPEAEEGMPKSTADYTACVKMSRDSVGNYFVEHVDQFRKHSGAVMDEIIKYAREDGTMETACVIPRDSGAGGVAYHQHMKRVLAENDVAAKTTVMSGHSSKLNRFLCFSSLAQNGNVFVVNGEWNDMWFNQLEGFVPNNRNQKDDMLDATADAANYLAKQLVLPTILLPTFSSSNEVAAVRAEAGR